MACSMGRDGTGPRNTARPLFARRGRRWRSLTFFGQTQLHEKAWRRCKRGGLSPGRSAFSSPPLIHRPSVGGHEAAHLLIALAPVLPQPQSRSPASRMWGVGVDVITQNVDGARRNFVLISMPGDGLLSPQSSSPWLFSAPGSPGTVSWSVRARAERPVPCSARLLPRPWVRRCRRRQRCGACRSMHSFIACYLPSRLVFRALPRLSFLPAPLL